MFKNALKFQKVIAEIIYLFLIFFFCYTAANKLMNLNSFRTNLLKTSLFSEDVANYFSVLVIILEFAIVCFMIFYKKMGLLFFTITMLFFTVYISFLRYKGLYEVCGCGGILNGLSYNTHLKINIGLIIGSLFSFYTFNILVDEK
jgi:hypothetical protein